MPLAVNERVLPSGQTTQAGGYTALVNHEGSIAGLGLPSDRARPWFGVIDRPIAPYLQSPGDFRIEAVGWDHATQETMYFIVREPLSGVGIIYSSSEESETDSHDGANNTTGISTAASTNTRNNANTNANPNASGNITVNINTNTGPDAGPDANPNDDVEFDFSSIIDEYTDTNTNTSNGIYNGDNAAVVSMQTWRLPRAGLIRGQPITEEHHVVHEHALIYPIIRHGESARLIREDRGAELHSSVGRVTKIEAYRLGHGQRPEFSYEYTLTFDDGASIAYEEWKMMEILNEIWSVVEVN